MLLKISLGKFSNSSLVVRIKELARACRKGATFIWKLDLIDLNSFSEVVHLKEILSPDQIIVIVHSNMLILVL